MALFNKKKNEEKQPMEVGSERAVETTMTPMPTGGDVQSMQVIVGPHMTEKAGLLNSQNTYVFKVATNANKIEIRKSIEKLYKVKVLKIAVVNIPAKKRRVGRQIGWKAGYKKAIITLQKGDSINQTA